MLRIKSFTLLLCAIIALFFIGCDSTEITPGKEPVVVLDTYELNVDGGGGNIPLFYAVENGIRGVKPGVKSSVEWITVKEITSDTITLKIEESDIDEERFGFVTITYKGMDKGVKVTVLQDAQLLNKFSFEVSDVTSNGCSVKYIPKSDDFVYMANVIDAEYFTQSGIVDMNIFIQNEMSNYLAIAQQYDLTLQSLLEDALSTQLLYSGEATRKFTGMQPGATYMAYAYGLELNGDEYTVTVPLHHTYVEIPMSQFYDVSFNIVAQMSNGSASIAVTPNNWSGYYVVSIIPDSSLYYTPKGESMSQYTLRAMGNDFYKRARQAIQGGVSIEAFLRSSCYLGAQSIHTPISGGTDYMVAVFAVESKNGEVPVMCSIPSIAYL